MRHLLAFLLAALPAVTTAQTEPWPTRPVRIVAPFPAGSTVDATLRLMQPHLADRS